MSTRSAIKAKLRAALTERLARLHAESLAARAAIVTRDAERWLHAAQSEGDQRTAGVQRALDAWRMELGCIREQMESHLAQAQAAHQSELMAVKASLGTVPPHQHPRYDDAFHSLRVLLQAYEGRLDALENAPHPLPSGGKPGQVLVKTPKGVAWEWLQPQVLQLRQPDTTPTPVLDNVIIDPDGTYIVDPDGTYITAL